MGEDRAGLAPRLLQRDDVGGSNLELALAAVAVGVALVERLAARGAHLKHQAALVRVEEIDLGPPDRTSGGPHEAGCQRDFGHGKPTRQRFGVTPGRHNLEV
jgi:hypothetical protein